MPSHKLKHCPRCTTSFECKTGSVLNCQCKAVYLRPDQLDYIARHFDGCLCAQCLESIAQEFNPIKPDLASIENA